MTEKKPTFRRKMVHAGGWQVVKRAARSLPFGGAAVVLFLVGSDIKQKGVAKGLINSGIDALPVIGLAKNAVEFVRGKDFLANKSEKAKKT